MNACHQSSVAIDQCVTFDVLKNINSHGAAGAAHPRDTPKLKNLADKIPE
jgi:hypothetical protein